jgi:preprotein translocase subunit SecA
MRCSARLATEYLARSQQKIADPREKRSEGDGEGFLACIRSYKALPKNKALIKYLSEEGHQGRMLKTEEIYMENNNRRMPQAVDMLYFVIDEKLNSATLQIKVPTGSPSRSTIIRTSSYCPISLLSFSARGRQDI